MKSQFIGGIIILLIVWFFINLWALNTISSLFSGPPIYAEHVFAYWIILIPFAGKGFSKS